MQHRRMPWPSHSTLAVVAGLSTVTIAYARPARSEESFASCRTPLRAPASRAVDHQALWRSAGVELPPSGQKVMLYSVGGEFETIDESIVAVREAPGLWRLTRVMRVASHIPPRPDSGAPVPSLTVADGSVSGEDGRRLEQALGDQNFYLEPVSCFPIEPPPIGQAQETLETSWNGRVRRFEAFGAPPGISGKVVRFLAQAARNLH